MQVDPSVTRRKYDRELVRLAAQRQTLEERGILPLHSAFPHVQALFVPRHPIRLLVPQPQRGLIIVPNAPPAVQEVPNLAARAFKVHLDLTDYDLRAPSVEFKDPWTNELLKYENLFRALEFEQHRKAHVVLLDDHPMTHKPFLCVRGTREYHEHPQHTGDDWLLYRTQMSVFSLLISIWRVCIDLVHPQMAFTNLGLQVAWTAEDKL